MAHEPIGPENCPDPSAHETFRYCPYCTWTEEPCGVAHPANDHLTCTLYGDHTGSHEAKVKWDA